MLLTKKKRQEYLRVLGFYKGAIDGIEGPKTKQAYKDLQNTYFFNKKDKDGKYGTNTDKLLRNAYYVKTYTKNFDLKKELSCECKGKYCTGYPVVYDVNALIYLQDVRDEYGSTNVTSPMRCKKLNNNTKGASKTSRHLDGKAFDFYNSKVCKNMTTRKAFIDKYIGKAKARYSYCDGYARSKTGKSYPNADNMGSCIHIDVK